MCTRQLLDTNPIQAMPSPALGKLDPYHLHLFKISVLIGSCQSAPLLFLGLGEKLKRHSKRQSDEMEQRTIKVSDADAVAAVQFLICHKNRKTCVALKQLSCACAMYDT